MKQQVMAEKIMKGTPLVLVTYLGSEASTVDYRDKKTGQAASFSQVKHTVLMGIKPVLISQRCETKGEADKQQAEFDAGRTPFPEQSKLVFHIESLTESRGHADGVGKLEIFEK